MELIVKHKLSVGEIVYNRTEQRYYYISCVGKDFVELKTYGLHKNPKLHKISDLKRHGGFIDIYEVESKHTKTKLWKLLNGVTDD